MFDMMKMMGKVKEVQEKMKEAQLELRNITVSAESGAGIVKATVNGAKEVVSLDIDPSVINSEDSEMMKDLIVAAINKAMAEAEIKSREHIKHATEGLLPNIPGFDFNNMV